MATAEDALALLGAGWGSDFRCEDQVAAAWIAGHLVRHHGFACEDADTAAATGRPRRRGGAR